MKSDSLAISPASLTTAVLIRITTHLGGLGQLIRPIYDTVHPDLSSPRDTSVPSSQPRLDSIVIVLTMPESEPEPADLLNCCIAVPTCSFK
jgi:hypothetical protein